VTTTKRKYPGPDKAPYWRGNLEDYPGYGFSRGEVTDPDHEWRNNEPFQANLTLTGISRGRSAIKFMWRDEEGHSFPMFAIDMAALVMTKEGAAGGKAGGQWIIMKRGSNYGVARYEA
jgi:hypothetical protein